MSLSLKFLLVTVHAATMSNGSFQGTVAIAPAPEAERWVASQNMPKIYRSILLLLCLAVTSGCMFLADRKVHVSGTVTDEAGHPLAGATVRFLAGVEDITDMNGGFQFGGVFPGGRLPIRVTKPGFKQYEGFNKFNYYDISVSLAGENSPLESKATWTILSERELKNFQRRKGH